MHERARERTPGLTIEELAGDVGLPVRTIRYYIAEGLLPGSEGRGKAASYGEEHLLRLRLVRLLSERHLPLSEIRERLQGLSVEDLRLLVRQAQGRSTSLERLESAPSPKDYVASLLRDAREARASHLLGSPAPPPSPMPSGSSSVGRARQAEAPASAPESWQRWELAPGVELHLRADAWTRHRELIERLLREAGHSANPTRRE